MKNATITLGVLLIVFYAGAKILDLDIENENFKSSNNENILVDSISQKINLNVQEINITEWNTKEGISYIQVPGANLGVMSFQVLDDIRIAFLSNSSNEIVIINRNDYQLSTRFSVISASRDFIYDKGLFYVLEVGKVVVYDEEGIVKSVVSFPDKFSGTERISRYDNSTYLLLASGNSVKIDSNNSFLESNVSEGWITQNNNFVLTSLNDENHFLVKVNTSSGKTFNKVFTIDKKIAGIYVVGNTLNRIILDLQLFLQENPISIERLIVSIDFNERGIGDILLSKKVPDCYYVLSNKDLDVGYNGIIYSMITSPRGVNVFALNETKEIIVNDYPRFLLDIKYHFNDHLIKVDINH